MAERPYDPDIGVGGKLVLVCIVLFFGASALGRLLN